MRHMLEGENLALCVGRQGHVVGDSQWNLIYCSKTIEDLNLFYRGGNVNFPLYRYFTAADRRTNISRELIECLANAHRNEPSPEDVFHYVYAVLHAPSYREKYAEFLRRDFPRVPFPVERDLFVKIASLGVRLAELHLLTSRELDQPSCQFPVQGEMKVTKKKADGFRYDSDMHRMYINKTQYFSPIPPEVYEYRIGGYQVCDKWLKDRKERCLKTEEVRTYCRMVTAIGHTIRIQAELDTLYPDVEKDLVSISAE